MTDPSHLCSHYHLVCRVRKRSSNQPYSIETVPHSHVVLNDYVTLMNRGDGRSSVSDSPPSDVHSSHLPTNSTVNGSHASRDSVRSTRNSSSSSSNSSSSDGGGVLSLLLPPSPQLISSSHPPPLPPPLPPPPLPAEASLEDYISNDVFFPNITMPEVPKELSRDNPEGCSIASSTSDTED